MGTCQNIKVLCSQFAYLVGPLNSSLDITKMDYTEFGRSIYMFSHRILHVNAVYISIVDRSLTYGYKRPYMIGWRKLANKIVRSVTWSMGKTAEEQNALRRRFAALSLSFLLFNFYFYLLLLHVLSFTLKYFCGFFLEFQSQYASVACEVSSSSRTPIKKTVDRVFRFCIFFFVYIYIYKYKKHIIPFN